MGYKVAIRLLLLVVAVLAASLVGVIVGWAARTVEPSNGRALIAGGTAFGGTLVLLITAFNFVMDPDA
ncbi:hypothetical protein [Micromonospora foliorum]|uniref:hypothetical protein n=1 Tax=Micromonospora foliorum TaxID=2911210 RepID=UPI001EE97668|nr:hypothetical protein [Micromonospora foliorum]MCG5438212.1 hypothetical protein [Micromonospora foliorum]